ncbi:hypothetical protein FBEOM_4701 [Fusarium beomiforme]|uniref:Uncharacterized protein n=1 Tax=Fusarium beomiforme TaxID=44412 RepID=A0A9P5DXU6_9HYPO|nr:hypothetical protein FBEOM_4701 [Fusarium beomiforme]
MPPPELPSRLVTVPWCEVINPGAHSHKSEPSPGHFRLTVPHAIIRNTHLYNQLRYSEELDNRSLKDIIDPLREEIAYHQAHDKNEMYGLSKTIVIKYGETSLRIIRRIWDLNLVYSSRPEVPGDLSFTFAERTWAGTLRDTVMYHMHIANHDQFKHGVYITDVLARDHDDRMGLATKEREVLSAVWEEINFGGVSWESSASSLGMTYESAVKLSSETVETFQETSREISEEKRDWFDMGEILRRQTAQLLNIAAQAAENWEPRRHGSCDNILAIYYEDMIRRRKNDNRKQNEELRKQLEAVLGDTRGGQVGMGSAGESEYDCDDESEDSEESEVS